MNQKRKTTLLIAAVAAAAAVLIAILLGVSTSQKSKYTSTIAEAEKAFESQDYTNAIASYKLAVKMDQESEDAWIGLSRSYLEAGYGDYAVETLEIAKDRVGDSERIRTELKTLEDIIKEQEAAKARQAQSGEAVLAWLPDLLERLTRRSFSAHETQSGIESKTAGSGGSILVRVKGIAADLIYRNTDANPDTIDGMRIRDDGLPTEIRLDDVMTLFGGVEQVTFEDLKTLQVSDPEITEDDEFGTAVVFDMTAPAGCSAVIACDADGTITRGAQNRILLQGAERGAVDKKKVSGHVLNAQDNGGVAGAKLTFREGTKEYGDAYAEVFANDNGAYEVELEPGEYTVEITAEGYVEEFKELFVDLYGETLEQDFLISALLDGGEARIVLQWGSTPVDLDAYLDGETDAGDDVFVYFKNRTNTDSAGNAIADLDIDDKDGYGPETITIHNLNGKYRFEVFDYNETGLLGESEATVTVYLPGQEPRTIVLNPSGFEAGTTNLWVVLTLDHGELDVQNRWESVVATPSNKG